MNSIIPWIERSAFGVCQALGSRMGIHPSRVRLYFVYASFFTFGSPIVLYFFLAFWMNIRQHLRRGWVALVH